MGPVTRPQPGSLRNSARHSDPAWVRWGLTAFAVVALTVLVVVPVVSVFVEAFAGGVGAYLGHLWEPDTRHAVLVTVAVAPCAFALNLVFGLAAAWAIARFRFRGRTALVTLIDLPFSISPVVVGLMFVILFGTTKGVAGPWLAGHGVQVLFTVPGLVLATTFVTLPFVARELIPVMESIGPDEELAALSLGASGWQLFWRVTLPNVKWGLLYGVILCNARAMGEFGAVYVVGGRVAGETNTMPLQVDQLFQGFNTPAAFALASVLTLLGLVTLALKTWIETKHGGRPQGAAETDRPSA